jgi:hypothetical protein
VCHLCDFGVHLFHVVPHVSQLCFHLAVLGLVLGELGQGLFKPLEPLDIVSLQGLDCCWHELELLLLLLSHQLLLTSLPCLLCHQYCARPHLGVDMPILGIWEDWYWYVPYMTHQNNAYVVHY